MLVCVIYTSMNQIVRYHTYKNKWNSFQRSMRQRKKTTSHIYIAIHEANRRLDWMRTGKEIHTYGEQHLVYCLHQINERFIATKINSSQTSSSCVPKSKQKYFTLNISVFMLLSSKCSSYMLLPLHTKVDIRLHYRWFITSSINKQICAI